MEVIIVLLIFHRFLATFTCRKRHFYMFCKACNVKRTVRGVGLFGMKVASIFCAHALSSQLYALTTPVY